MDSLRVSQLATLMLPLLAGCGAERPVGVGVALSGSFVEATRLALEDVAAGGGLPLLDTMLVGEATSRAAPALEIADRFRRMPRIVAVVAHSNSASSLATAPVYNEAEIVQVAPTSTAASYSAAGPFSFRLAPSDGAQGEVLAAALDSLQPTGARVAILYVNDDYGRGVRQAFLARLDRTRHTVVHDQPHRDDELAAASVERGRDVRSAVRSVLASRPGAIFWFGRARTFDLYLSAIRDEGGAIPIFGSDGLATWGGGNRSDGQWDGVRYTDFLDLAGTAELRDFGRRFRERFGTPAGTGEVLSHDAMRLILAAVRDGARTGPAVRDWLHSLGRTRAPFPGLSGPIAFDEAGDVARSYVLVTIAAPGR